MNNNREPTNNMPNADQHNYYDHSKKTASAMLKGAAVGIFGRWVTFPLEKIYLDRSKNPTLSYAEICRFNFHPKILVKVQTSIFLSAGAGQTIGKAISTMGVVRAVEEKYPELSPLNKGLAITVFSSPLECLVTVRGEYNKLLLFAENEKNMPSSMHRHGIFTPAFLRFTNATMLRCTWSSVLTYCPIYFMERYIKSFFPPSYKDAPILKAAAAGISTSAMQIFIMPVINLQTHQANHPELTLAETAKTLLKAPNKLFAGTAGRTLNRGMYYGLAFFANEYSKKWTPPEKTPTPKAKW